MAKISAVGSRAFFGGYDVSGDVTALGGIEMSANLADITGLSSTAMERLLLRRDGKISFNAILNAAAGGSHPIFKTLAPNTQTEVDCMWAQANAVDAICAMLAAKQATFNSTLGTDGSYQITADAFGALGVGLEWGQLCTAGKRQDTTATASGTGTDMGIPPTSQTLTVTSASAANPTSVLTSTPHGYTTGDSVIIAGTNRASLNSEHTITVVDATHFTVPVDLSGGAATSGTVILTSTRTGWAAQRQTFSFTGTSSTVTLQHAPINSAAAFVDVTGGAFTAATAVGAERITGASTALLQRYVRVKTTGTFSEHTFAVGVLRL